MAKENISKMKREPTIWGNIFANDTSDKGLISKIYKELTQLHSRTKTTQLKKWAVGGSAHRDPPATTDENKSTKT